MKLSRRDFVKKVGLATASLAVPPFVTGKTIETGVDKHIILIVFGGGIRNKETILNPRNVPNLMSIAARGVVCPNIITGLPTHFRATRGIFTGCLESENLRFTSRLVNPTVFECVRKHCSLPPDKVWVSMLGYQEARRLTCSEHKAYGKPFRPNLITGDGILNRECRIDRAQTDSSGGSDDHDYPPKDPDIERSISGEMSKEHLHVEGQGGYDTQVLRFATQIMRIFKPNLMAVRLTQADVAHNSFEDYIETIRQNDEEIGKLWNEVQNDTTLKGKTTILILPEFGRDKYLNEKHCLDHGDGSHESRKVALIASGPGFKVNKVIRKEHNSSDITPTICKMFGFKPPFCEGRVLNDLFIQS